MEIRTCCGTTCDKAVAIKEYTELKEWFIAITEAYEVSQADHLFTSLQGHQQLGQLIKKYKEVHEDELRSKT